MLAEACQMPNEVRKYFGDNGDEFHMGFHFPVMPRVSKDNKYKPTSLTYKDLYVHQTRGRNMFERYYGRYSRDSTKLSMGHLFAQP